MKIQIKTNTDLSSFFIVAITPADKELIAGANTAIVSIRNTRVTRNLQSEFPDITRFIASTYINKVN